MAMESERRGLAGTGQRDHAECGHRHIIDYPLSAPVDVSAFTSLTVAI